MKPLLMDEMARPSLRSVIGALLGAATEASIAITNVRLAAVDLEARETVHVRQCRILLGRLDARAFDYMPTSAASLEPLLHFVESPRVQIRSLGLATWTPDFSIYSGLPDVAGAPREACLVGAHYFHEPPGGAGPALTCVLTDSVSVGCARERFEQLWLHGYDVRETVLTAVREFARARG